MGFFIYKRLVKTYKTFNNKDGNNSISHTSIVAIGDKRGGFGVGKASNLNQSISIFKAFSKAKINFFKICLKNGTIPHPIIGRSCGYITYMFPIKKFHTFSCGSYIRSIMNVIGIRNISIKIYGSGNFYNILKSFMNAFMSLNSYNFILNKKGNVFKKN